MHVYKAGPNVPSFGIQTPRIAWDFDRLSWSNSPNNLSLDKYHAVWNGAFGRVDNSIFYRDHFVSL
jgi:hypothetical protein